MEIKEINKEDVFKFLPKRTEDTHKGTYGKLMCICGSTRYRGAAALATEGALRMGVGIVCLASIEAVFASIQTRLAEAILLPCESDKIGGIDYKNIDQIKGELANGYTSIAIGSGMGNSKNTFDIVNDLLINSKLSIVLDADALNAISHYDSDLSCLKTNNRSSIKKYTHSNIKSYKDSKSNVNCISNKIITPHPGEMARLCGCSISELKANRTDIISRFAKSHNVILVLKEHKTLIASPDGQIWANTTGNSGLARGGSGDILTGMIGALLAQGLDACQAAICGVWLHGYAADLCAQRKSKTSMLPHDIFDDLGQILLNENR